MTRRLKALGLGIVVLAMSNCALFFEHVRIYDEANTSYLRGDYDYAIDRAVDALRKKPGYEDASQLLLKALPKAYDRHQQDAANYEKKNQWDSAVAEYTSIHRLVEKVKNFPDGFPTVDVSSKLEQATNNAAEAHYQSGKAAMADVNQSAKAAKEFVAAQQFIPNYKDSQTLAAEAHYQAGKKAMAALGQSDKAASEFVSAQIYVPNYKDSQVLSAEAYYRDGIESLKNGNHKAAAKQFRNAATTVRGYKDAQALYEKSLQTAIKRIAVMPFDNKSGKTQFGAIGEALSDQVIAKAMSRNHEFVEFVTRDRLNELMKEQGLGLTGAIDEKSAAKVGKVLGIHAFVVGKISSITVAYPPMTSTTTPYQKTVTMVNYQTGQTYPVNYTAQLTTYAVSGKVEVNGNYQIIEAERGTIGKMVEGKKEESQNYHWARYTGHKEALPSEVLTTASEQERHPEPQEVLVQRCVENLAKDFAQDLVGYFQ